MRVAMKRPQNQDESVAEPRPETTMVDPMSAPAPEREPVTPRKGHVITLEGVHAHYGEQHAVRGVDVTFASNEVTAMIGPSGCGKSTLVRCINRMHEEIPGARMEGKIRLDDADIYGEGVD